MKIKTAIVTGAAGSLGSDLSRVLAIAGWNVIMLDQDRKGLEQASDRIPEEAPGEVALYPMDLAGAGPGDVETLFETAVSEFGGLDALVHCAVRFKHLTPLEHVSPEEWLMHMQVNLNAAWLLSTMALNALRDADAGKIVFLLEDLAKVEGSLWGPYGVSKHALRAMVNQLAGECRAGTVAVRGVDPGPMRSPIRGRVYFDEDPATMPSPEKPARLIAGFLEGDESWEDVFIDLSSQVSD